MSSSMRRRSRIIAATVLAAACSTAAQPAAADTICVGNRPGCSATIQGAVDRAHDSDLIKVAAGTYAGGVRIDSSVRIVGAGAGATIIRGGGPVLTIGTFGATTEPTVSISAVTVTGGVTRSSPLSALFTGAEGVFAAGGGVEIPFGADFGPGATVTISDSVIADNRVAPSASAALGPPCPGGVACPFALAGGGGVDNNGSLTLRNTTVTRNRVGTASGLSTLASDAVGAGIITRVALTLDHSTVSSNVASATAPNGRFAESGGIHVDSGTLTIIAGAVSDNTARLDSGLPTSGPDAVDQAAIGGGIHVTGGASAVDIRGVTISGNALTATNTAGDANAFSGGLHSDIPVALASDVLIGNSVTAEAKPGSPGSAFGDSGAGEMFGTITTSRLSDNSVTAISASGDVTASAGASIFGGTMTASIVSANHVRGLAPNGTAVVSGGGLMADGDLTLRNSALTANTGEARGHAGSAKGGGLFAAEVPNGPPAGLLSLTNTLIARNSLSGGTSITLRGGGLFTTNPLTLVNSRITGNAPDQCDGC